MTDVHAGVADEMQQALEAQQAQETPFLCETCGQFRATHILASLEERDTSLFCGSCLVVTFAKVASDLGQQQG